MAKIRTKMITVKVAEATAQEFKVAALMRGAGMSGLLHQYIVSIIREEKERDLVMFENKISELSFDSKSPNTILKKQTLQRKRKAS